MLVEVQFWKKEFTKVPSKVKAKFIIKHSEEGGKRQETLEVFDESIKKKLQKCYM